MYHHKDYHTIINLLFIGLLIRTVFAAVIVTVAIWLLLKVGRLADAYTTKIKSSTDNQTLASAYEQNFQQNWQATTWLPLGRESCRKIDGAPTTSEWT